MFQWPVPVASALWVPVICLLVPFFMLCFSIGYKYSKRSGIFVSSKLEKELRERKRLSVQYEKMNLKDFQIGNDLSLAFRNFHCIPIGIASSRRAWTIKKVDLTETNIQDFANLHYFKNVETLVFDKNDLDVRLFIFLIPFRFELRIDTVFCRLLLLALG